MSVCCRSAYLRIASMHIFNAHTLQTEADLQRLTQTSMPANPFKSLKIGVCGLVWLITCAGLTVACDEHGRPGKTPSQRTRAKRIELAAHWKCDYSVLPRLETERKRARSDLALFFYVLKSAPRFLLLTPNVHGLLIDWHWA